MDLAALFVARSRYFLGTEYRIKLWRAVEAIPEERLWSRPNDESNSVGNLLAHLAGNIRQWIVAGVGNAPDARDRAAEFAARGGASAAELLRELGRALDEVDAVLASLEGRGAEALLERRTIQGRDVTVFEAIHNVTEHFALHLGQVIYMAKLYTPGAVRFYEDAGGLARPIWR